MTNITWQTDALDLSFDNMIVDRQEELSLLSQKILSKNRIIWLCAPGGTGKTALIHVFRSKFKKLLALHKTKIINLYARDFSNYENKIVNAVKNEIGENVLLIIDDSEEFNEPNLNKVLNLFHKFTNLKILFSSRHEPNFSKLGVNDDDFFVLRLKSPNIISVLKRNIELISDKEKRQKAIKALNNFISKEPEHDLSPREAITKFKALLETSKSFSELIREEPGESIKEGEGNVIDIKIDYTGIVLALVLFLLSYINSSKSEDRISEKIEDVQQTIENVIALSPSSPDQLFFVNRNVNLRNLPTTKGSEIIKVLPKNIVVTTLKKENGWYWIEYKDYANDIEFNGWVYSKYLTKIIN